MPREIDAFPQRASRVTNSPQDHYQLNPKPWVKTMAEIDAAIGSAQLYSMLAGIDSFTGLNLVRCAAILGFPKPPNYEYLVTAHERAVANTEKFFTAVVKDLREQKQMQRHLLRQSTQIHIDHLNALLSDSDFQSLLGATGSLLGHGNIVNPTMQDIETWLQVNPATEVVGNLGASILDMIVTVCSSPGLDEPDIHGLIALIDIIGGNWTGVWKQWAQESYDNWNSFLTTLGLPDATAQAAAELLSGASQNAQDAYDNWDTVFTALGADAQTAIDFASWLTGVNTKATTAYQNWVTFLENLGLTDQTAIAAATLLTGTKETAQQAYANWDTVFEGIGLTEQTAIDLASWLTGVNTKATTAYQNWVTFLENLGLTDQTAIAAATLLTGTKETAQQAYANWDTVFEGIGLSQQTAIDLASWLTGVNTKATTAYQNWDDFFTALGLSSDTATAAADLISGADTNAQSAYDDWNTLLTSLGFGVTTSAELSTWLTGVHGTATQAQSDANDAVTTANDADTKAIQSQQNWTDFFTGLGLSNGTATESAGLITDLQQESDAEAQNAATLWSQWETAITSPGTPQNPRSIGDVISDFANAYSTYVQANRKVQQGEWATLTDIFSTILGFDSTTGQIGQDRVSGLGNSWNQLESALSGDTTGAGQWSWLANLLNGKWLTLDQANQTGVTNTNVLAERNNKPLIYGLDDTTESNIPFSPPMTAIECDKGSGYSQIAFIRCQQSSIKNTVAFIASSPQVATNYFRVALYKVDFLNEKIHPISVENLGPQLTAAKKWMFISANSTPAEPGDVFAVIFQSISNYTINVYGVQSNDPDPVHPNAKLPGLAGDILVAGGPLTNSKDFSTINFSNAQVPYVALEISNPPPPSYGDVSTTFTGSTTHTIASWLKYGDKVDIIGIPGGGGGQGNQGYANGRGGNAGRWIAKTLTVGTDIKVGGTVTVTVGEGGEGGAWWNPGDRGGATKFEWIDANNNAQSLTAGGGYGGGLLTPPTQGSFGASPGNKVWNGVTYEGGAVQIFLQTGNVPGGGGAGASTFQYGFDGGRGQAWAVERQS